MSIKVGYSRPADKSLKTFKEWLTNFNEGVTGKPMKVTEEEWIKDWKEFWGKTDGKI